MSSKALLIKCFMYFSVSLALAIKSIYQLLTNRKISQQQKNICVIRLDKTVGDTVMNSAFLKSLRGQHPEARITLVVHKNSYSLVEKSTVVDEVKIYNPGNSLKYSLINRLYKTLKFVVAEFSYIPDIAIVPRFDEDHNAAFISLFSLAPVRAAWTEKTTVRKSLLNYSFDRMSTNIVTSSVLRHEVERGTELLKALFKNFNINEHHELDIWLTEKEVSDVTVKYQFDVTRNYICLGISSGHSVLKQWPLDYFVHLAKKLYSEDSSRIFILLGAKGDIHQGSQFIDMCGHEIPVINLIAKTTLRETGAILKLCSLYVGNDSGNIHLAAAAQIPIVGLYGSSCAHRFSPWGTLSSHISHEKECGPCAQGHIIDRCSTCIYEKPLCMYEITVDQVCKKIESLSK